MIFGTHADIIAKSYGTDAGADTGFTDFASIGPAGNIARRSDCANDPHGGVGCIYVWDANSSANLFTGARLMYDGDESTVHVIDDDTEDL